MSTSLSDSECVAQQLMVWARAWVSTQKFRVDRQFYREIQEDKSELSGDDHARSIGSETARGDYEMQSEGQWGFPDLSDDYE